LKGGLAFQAALYLWMASRKEFYAMEQVTLEQVQTEAQALSDNDQRLLRAWLDTKLRQQNSFYSIEEIARAQGKRPVSFQELLGPEPDADDDDDVDEFLAETRAIRQASKAREFD
jgi:hypothetical protein